MNQSARKMFLAAQAALYILFLALDLSGHMVSSIPFKYAGILLCVLAALTAVRTLDGRLTALALCFTAAADWFLLVMNAHYAVGIALFCVVQGLYCVRLAVWRGRLLRPLLAVRLLPLILFVLLRVPLDALALLYFVNLACNAFEAALTLPPDDQQRCLALGLGLFICCDLCVGAFNLGLLTGLTRYGMWLFYLPSQVLLTLSAQPKGAHAA